MSDQRNGSSTPAIESSRSKGLSARSLGTWHIIVMVIAVAATIAIVVATTLAAVAMALSAIGYVRLIPHVTNAGACYALISASISPVLGLSAFADRRDRRPPGSLAA